MNIKNRVIKKIKYRREYPIRLTVLVVVILAVLFGVASKLNLGVNANGGHLKFRETNDDEIRITFVGDIMTSRYVQTEIDKVGFDALISDASDTWKDSDLVLANIENAIVNNDISEYIMADKNIALGTTEENLLLLRDAGIDVFGFANNHIADYGLVGLRETLNILTINEIDTIGIGNSKRNLEEFYQIYEINGLNIGIVGHSDIVPKGFSALNNKPGVASEFNQVANEVIDRIRDDVDILILMIHWGDEYALKVNQEVKTRGREYIDKGVDIVIGSHPHVIQPVEKYNDGVIIYSMGNFIFDQAMETTNATAMGSLVIDQDLNIQAEFIPFEIHKAIPKRVSSGTSYRIVESQLTRMLNSSDVVNKDGIITMNIRGEKYVEEE